SLQLSECFRFDRFAYSGGIKSAHSFMEDSEGGKMLQNLLNVIVIDVIVLVISVACAGGMGALLLTGIRSPFEDKEARLIGKRATAEAKRHLQTSNLGRSSHRLRRREVG